MKNILLVQVVDDYGLNKFLPLAIAYQWLYAANDAQVQTHWQVADVLIEKLPIDNYVQSLDQNIDVVAMSCYVWNWTYNNELAKRIKHKFPGCLIVIGGPEVNKHDPDLIRNRPWFDVAVLGENEPILQKILRGATVNDITSEAGVVTKYTQAVIQPSRTRDLREIPSPILSGFYDGIMQGYRERGINVDYWQVTWETMRGCPYHCAFCDIGDDYWNKTIWFDLDRIYPEIDWMGTNKIEYLSVCDSNWGIHPRDIDITRYIIDTKIRTGYPRILDVTWAKNNPDRVRTIIEMDRDAGTGLLRGLNLSLQSMDPYTLKVNSRFNLVDHVLDETLTWYRANDIPTFSEVIWPLPGETLQSFTKGLQHTIDLGQKDFIVIHPLVCTNNSPLGQLDFRKDHGIKTQVVPVDTFWMRIPDSADYVIETEEAVIATNTASYEDFLRGNMIGHWTGVLYYYGWAHYAMRWMRQQHNVRELDFVQDWIVFCEQRPNSIQGREHVDTLCAYRAVFEHDGHWGRQLPDPFDDIYWEYKSGTAAMFQQHQQELRQELAEFLAQVYNVNDTELVDLNFMMCVDQQRTYPVQRNYRAELTKGLLNLDGESIEIWHRDRELVSGTLNAKQFAARVYHHRRKMRHWRCDVRAVADGKTQ